MPVPLSSAPLTSVDETLVEEARRFAEERVRPHAEEWEQAGIQPEETLREGIALFAGVRIAEDRGGLGRSASTIARVYEELARVDLGFTCALAVHNNVAIATSLVEDEALRKRWLGPLISGEAIGAFLLTEPGAGSDAAAITTSAVARDGRFVINGHKAWVTNGQSADVLATFALTDPKAGARSMAGFLVDATSPGLKKSDSYKMLGNHAMGVCEIEFTECAVPAGDLAFRAGRGFKAALYGIDVARFGVAAMCNGALEGGLSLAVDYASQRRAFGRPIIQHQGLQWMLAEAVTRLEASRMLTFRTAQLFDEDESPSLMAAHAKKFSTRAAFEGLSDAMEAMGANGLLRENTLARQLSGARVTYYMDGTSEIMNVIIGRSLAA
jgi:alkylation response protein AidB-like acyl-CoA dehydrogenase